MAAQREVHGVVIGDGGAGIRGLALAAGNVVELRVQGPVWHEAPVRPRIDVVPGCVARILVGCLVDRGFALGIAAAVTCLNPYGWRLYVEIYESLTDRFMIETPRAWQPVSFQGWAR